MMVSDMSVRKVVWRLQKRTSYATFDKSREPGSPVVGGITCPGGFLCYSGKAKP
jgi:hypothetical protein